MIFARRPLAQLCNRSRQFSTFYLRSAAPLTTKNFPLSASRSTSCRESHHGQGWSHSYHSSAVTAAVKDSAQEQQSFGDGPRVSVLMELTDRIGVLHDVLKFFWKYDINVSRIESRPAPPASQWEGGQRKFDFFLDFDGSLEDPAVQKLMTDLGPLTTKLLVLDEKDVRWFPRHISELDLIAHRILDAGVDLESDHPGFHDDTYRKRRAQLAQNALQHQWDKPIPFIQYSKEEIETWGIVWDRMQDLWKQYACKEFLVR